MNLKGLGKYKLNKAFTEGVDIRLDDAPDVAFKVRLPSQYNRGYTQALYGAVNFDIGSDGIVKTGGNLIETRYAQEDAFLEYCLVSVDGEDIPQDFADEYPEAVSELMAKASELANGLDDKVASTVGKSSASSTGKQSGEEKSSSTASLRSAAS